MNGRIAALAPIAMVLAVFYGCATAPKAENQAGFVTDSRAATAWFEKSVGGLSGQLNASGGFVVFPDVTKWGTLFGGGTVGKGVVCTADGKQVGWAAVNTSSIGLQAGVEGFKALVVLHDADTLQKLKSMQLQGSVAANFVAVDKGLAKAAPFDQGVAVYVGAAKGLFAGMNVGLHVIRFEALKAGEKPYDLR